MLNIRPMCLILGTPNIGGTMLKIRGTMLKITQEYVTLISNFVNVTLVSGDHTNSFMGVQSSVITTN